jgi:hypothetical protein
VQGADEVPRIVSQKSTAGSELLDAITVSFHLLTMSICPEDVAAEQGVSQEYNGTVFPDSAGP